MKKLRVVVMTLLAVSMAWVQGVQAQEAGAKAVPLELLVCSWRDGKGMDDLNKANKRFNKWADKHDAAYSAWTITPQFRSSDDEFDVGWIGVWPSGADMGAGLQAWHDNSGEAGEAFDKVIDCSSTHGLFSSVAINVPEGDGSDTPLVQFASCSIAEGASAEDVHKAHTATSKFMKSHGAQSASWILWPGLGAGDIDFDYYFVVAYNSYEQLGNAFEAYSNGGGYQMIQKAMSGVAECDNPRLYDGIKVRGGTGG